MRLTLSVFVLATILTILSLQTYAADAAPDAPKYWDDIPEQAEVLAATFVGGPGHEWLVSGGFQPDGTIVAAGNFLGPVLQLSKPATVIGEDQPPPPEAKRIPKMKNGQPEKDKAGMEVFQKPSWKHAGVTGFVVRLSGDLKELLSGSRMPFDSGAITSCVVDKTGAVYIAGRASETIAFLRGDVQEGKAQAEPNKSAGCDHTFVAKLSADCSKCEWVRHVRGPSEAPKLSLSSDGNIQFAAQDLRTFDLQGKQLSQIRVPGGMRETVSVSPIDKSIVTGGEHHWPTGREPWRCPTLNILKPDGSLKYQLYDWGGPYVGLDNCRQVSDSAVRAVTHDSQGNIFIYAWSDGGNSVMTTEPMDVRQQVAPKGLGITAAGAGVLSCAYLIKIDPKNFNVTGWTIWLAFRGRKPNSVWIDSLGYADDGSVAFAGRSAYGLWQTRNKLTEAPPAGNYIAVLNPDMSGVRFASVVPGTGVTTIGNDEKAGWGIASGFQQGKARVLFFSGAVEEEEDYGVTTKTPTKNALQEHFGGGWSDGYIVLLDLSKGTVAKPAEVAREANAGKESPTRASFEVAAQAKNRKHAATPPPEGTTFHFVSEYPKWVTVDAEIRDRAKKFWPTFMSGKPASGELIWKAAQPEGKLTVACTTLCQPRGDQSRRIFGEYVAAEKSPKVELTLEAFGPAKTEDLTSLDRKGNPQLRTVEYFEAQGTLHITQDAPQAIAEVKVKVKPRVTFSFSGPKEGPPDTIHLDAFVTLKATELALHALKEDALVDVRFGLNGTTQTAPPLKPKK